MLIYHPSNKKFDIVKVSYFGENFYTQNDKKSSPIQRSFWYTELPIPEDRFKDVKYIYIANININRIYDIEEDKFNFRNKFKTIHKLLLYLKQQYIGLKYKIDTYNLIILFKDIKPTSIQCTR